MLLLMLAVLGRELIPKPSVKLVVVAVVVVVAEVISTSVFFLTTTDRFS